MGPAELHETLYIDGVLHIKFNLIIIILLYFNLFKLKLIL